MHGSNHALYDAACDYAERLAFADAEKHFATLVRRNDADYADAAAQWLELTRLYTELIEIKERRSAAFIFQRKWTSYTALFPKHFLKGIFDPKGLAVQEQDTEAERERLKPDPPSKPARKRSVERLPAPFTWVEIPGGRGTMKTDEKNVTLSIPTERYWIAKYPVTNAQFAQFMQADGYTTERWWTPNGLAAQQKNNWTKTRFWDDSKFNGAEQPVVGVSWYEAVAFCLWLKDVTGESVMLPTEAQWQRAAQGNTSWAYPWGDQFDNTRCNNSVGSDRQKNSTSPVTRFEGKGDSPLGVVDMAGNVWEWCSTAYESGSNNLSGTDVRVLRGGSWLNNDAGYFRCGYRDGYAPDFWFNNTGFRLALS